MAKSIEPQFHLNGLPFFWGGERRKEITQEAMDFEFLPDDILVTGFPRSGKIIQKYNNV